MEQKDINFEVKKYVFSQDFIDDGLPVRYFEFNNSEYYGLVAVRKGYIPNTDFISTNPIYQKAIEIYTETVIGDDDEAEIESYPKEISKSEALLKYLLADDNKHEVVSELISVFEHIENGLILIDGNLI